ncbi:P-loop containing nucleoside triphosphate hydrolase protein [Serendipita vermifera]|nr:P-loop containing nucleoside triphosphate hydrolase protein [Serendipita vermifera]
MTQPPASGSNTEGQHDDSTPRIILMGATGSGKSTYITRIVGKDLGIVGHDLQSCTQQIKEFPTEYKGRKLVLVDTPGFDDTDVPDVVILKRIGDWLKKKYLKKEALAGVIYLHRISDNRFSGSAKRNLKTFQALCGPDYSPRIALVTTHWAEEGTRRYNQDVIRHETFEQRWWKGLSAKGARIFALLDDTPYYAEPILDDILHIRGRGETVLMQDEVGKDKKKVAKTTAGKELDSGITDRIKQLEEEKSRLQQELKSTKGADPDTKEQLDEVNDESRLLKSRRAKLNGDVVGMLRYNVLRL